MNKYKKQIYLFVFITMLIGIAGFAVLFINFRKQVKLQNEILRIEKTVIQADSLTNNLLQVESDKRGFQLTSDVSYLKNFHKIKDDCRNTLADLQKNTISPANKLIIDQVDSLMRIRISNLDSGISLFTTRGTAAALEFMELKVKKDIREKLNYQLGLLRDNFLHELKTNTAHINRRGDQNLAGLLILLSIFILVMLIAGRTFRRVQLKIIKSHIKFKEAQRIARLGSWEWNIATNKVTWSQEQFRLFGRERKNFNPTLEGYLSHLSEPDQKNVSSLIKNAVEGKGNYAVEHEIIRGDGSKLTVCNKGTVVYDENHKPVGLIGTTQDISERKKVERELLLAQKKYQTIFDNVTDGVYQSTLEGRFIMVNPALSRMFGYKNPGELISTVTNIGAQIYARAADRQRMSELLVRNDHVENFEVKLLTKKGEVIWVSESTRAVRNEKGAIMYFEGTVRNITEQKRAEEEMLAAQKKYQAIFDNTANGIYQSTADGKFIMVNPSMARIFRYDSPEELVSSITNIAEQIYADPVERKRMTEMINTEGHIENHEVQVLTKYGETIWVSVDIRVVRNDDGGIQYFEGILEDITNRKKSEEQLLSLSNRLQLAVHATSIGIWDWDIINNTTVWDQEMYRIYNVSPDDARTISEAWASTIHPDDLARVNRELEMAIKGEKEYDTEFRVIWTDKTIHHVKGNALAIKDPSGTTIRMIGTNADITERKEAEEEILQLNRSLDQFANITAHDLQEPIRMVSGFLGLLDKKYNDALDEQGKSYIFRAKDGADRMSILIKDLLEFSRSGNTAAKKNYVDLSFVMDLVDKDLSIVMADTGTILRLPDSMPVVFGTQSALYRLLLNLVSNGIKFRKKDTIPVVTIKTIELSDCWEFTVQDNGIGVAEKDQPRLFQAFQRLHRREEYPGTGLGLVTCKKIVETHGGRIWMTSEFGKGTTFHFTISKAQDFTMAA